MLIQEQFSLGNWFGTVSGRLQDHEDFGSAPTYRMAAGYLHPELGTRLHANVGTAFKAPSLAQLYGTFAPNPDLDPEKSTGFEFGIEQPAWEGRIRMGVTYFQNRLRDLITFSGSFPDFIQENVEHARTEGFESFVQLRLSDRFYARADWTYLSAENLDTGEDLLRRPKQMLDLRVEARPLDDATLSLGVRYLGPRDDIDSVSFTRSTLPGYTVVDLAANYQLNRYFKLFARIDNLFDRDYQDPDGYQHEGFNAFAGLRGSY